MDVKEKYKEAAKKFRMKYPEKARQYSRNSYSKRRQVLLEHYGGAKPACACCGETMTECLQIDHRDGKGKEHRELIGGHVHMYIWLLKNNFPEGFQVLCKNCNIAKGREAVCPHKRDRDLVALAQNIFQQPVVDVTETKLIKGKSKFCPHWITRGGKCAKCLGGIAK